jgi:signal transduction histidine kinase
MTSCLKPDDLLAQVRAFDIFSEVDDAALQWMIDSSTYHCLEKDEYFFRSGDTANHMQLILSGGYLVRLESDGRKRELGFWEAPMVAGILPFSRMTTITAEGVTTAPTNILQLHKDHFIEMVNQSYPLTQALVAVMTNRVRDYQQIQLMDEKLMALGKMSAGLAHELNNPAAAMIRSAQELHRHMQQTPERFKATVTMRVSEADVDVINEVLFERMDTGRKNASEDLSLMEREERNDDLMDWFEDHEIENGDEIADTLIDWEFQPEHLDRIAAVLPSISLQPVIWWIETSLTTESLVNEIQTASSRISELVTSIKSYSHMDSDPSMEFIDIHEGLASTLTMLKFKFKKKDIVLKKEWDRELPSIKALAGELNQVWTNLIVNALDALGERDGSCLTIRTYRRRDNFCIDIEDNGPGIPPNIQSRIFEPFFTTKGIGEGTGMGLDIVRHVLERHNGSISVDSAPGRTCFLICFPL